MNVEQLINYIKTRLAMFIGEITLSNLEQFIGGFIFNNAINHKIDDVDELYRREFQDWVNVWILKNYGIEVKEGICWSSKIMMVANNESEALYIFLQIVEEFFKEFHSRQLK